MSKSPKRNIVKDGIAFTGKSWSYVLRIPDPVTGKSKPKWVGGFDTQESALLARDEARVALRKRTYVPPSERTVGEFLNTWLHTIHRQQLKVTTFHAYEKIVRNYLVPGLGLIKLSDLKPSDVQRFYTETLSNPGVSGKNLEPRTVEFAGAILKKAIKYAVEVEGVLAFNPVSRVALPKTNPKVPTPWNMQELDTYLETARTHRLFFFFRLSAYTGARRGELLALKWTDFDGSYITISKSRTLAGREVIEANSTKGGKGGKRRVKLDPETIELFNEHRKRQLEEVQKFMKLGAWNNTGYVFVQENGLPLDTGTPSHLFGKLSKVAGLRSIRLHDLRHLHATELLRLGEPLHVVSDRLGHKDPMVTATIYAHVSDEQAETASNTFANRTRNAI